MNTTFSKFLLMFFTALICCNYTSAQTSPEGIWRTVDDATKQPKSHVQIEKRNGKYYGKIIQLLEGATTKVCGPCPGDRKGKSLEGMEILWDLSPYENYWSYGGIIDPKTGKIYKCSVWLEGQDKLIVRGYIGISLLGRSQTWERVK
ncbi:MAG TPA: DUF2147 domain-containing protein [Saprospiraceae bacterium]|nr:DUF2147 domain-containing protein [Saprospiraceae bacterium]